MTNIGGVLLLVTLLLMIFMAIRDGKAFFADWIRSSVLLIVLVVSILAWAPWAHSWR